MIIQYFRLCTLVCALFTVVPQTLATAPQNNDLDDIDPQYTWQSMGTFAQYRSDWFQSKLAHILDEQTDIEAKLKAAREIMPATAQELKNIEKPGLSQKTAQHFAQKKYLQAVHSDLLFTSQFWTFLARTLHHFAELSTEDATEQHKKVLLHLAKEMKHFEIYAGGDIEEDATLPYFRDELFLIEALLYDCQTLAKFYQIDDVEGPNPLLEKDTDTQLGSKEFYTQALEGKTKIKLGIQKDLSQGDEKFRRQLSPYFMDQLLEYREKLPDHSIPEESDGRFQVFKTYQLESTGPNLIERLKTPPVPEQKTKTGKKPKPAKLKSKGKKPAKAQSAQKKKKTHQPRKTVTRQPKPKQEKKVKQNKNQPQIIEKEDLENLDELLEFYANQDSAAQKEKVQPAFAKAQSLTPEELSQGWMLVSSKAKETFTLALPQVPLRQINLNIQYRNPNQYRFMGKTYSLPFFKKSLETINLPFLQDIKVKLYHSPKTKRLPNIATSFVRFHVEMNGQPQEIAFDLNNLYCSGVNAFLNQNEKFKQQKNLITAMQDFLSPVEQKNIGNISSRSQKSIACAKAITRKLCQQIIGGAWWKNCLDSEALLLLDLQRQLPNILKSLTNQTDPTKISGLVLGISSYRDCCPLCQKLLQGFQWNLCNQLQKASKGKVQVDENFASLVLTMGQIRPDSLINQPVPDYQEEAAVLKPGSHTFVAGRNSQTN